MPGPLSQEQRGLIVMLRSQGYRVSDIQQLTGITRKSIYFWLRRWEESGELRAHHRMTYQRVTTSEQDAAIVAAHHADPFRSTKSSSSHLGISTATVRRRLRDAGFVCHLPKRCDQKPPAEELAGSSSDLNTEIDIKVEPDIHETTDEPSTSAPPTDPEALQPEQTEPLERSQRGRPRKRPTRLEVSIPRPKKRNVNTVKRKSDVDAQHGQLAVKKTYSKKRKYTPVGEDLPPYEHLVPLKQKKVPDNVAPQLPAVSDYESLSAPGPSYHVVPVVTFRNDQTPLQQLPLAAGRPSWRFSAPTLPQRQQCYLEVRPLNQPPEVTLDTVEPAQTSLQIEIEQADGTETVYVKEEVEDDEETEEPPVERTEAKDPCEVYLMSLLPTMRAMTSDQQIMFQEGISELIDMIHNLNK